MSLSAKVYFKSGFDPKNYPSENEWEARVTIERSAAIKAPRIEYQLMCSKKFQSYLANQPPEAIESLLLDNTVAAQLLRATFVGQHEFRVGEATTNARLLDKCKHNYEHYVLKPQLEGGGNNVFGAAIRDLVERIEHDEAELSRYVLMERIVPQTHFNYLVRPTDATAGLVRVDSELGVFGVSIGRDDDDQLIVNEYAGYGLFTKDARMDEWGSNLGLGVWDSIYFT